MALIDDVKLALRVSSDAFDAEVAMYVASALTDMRRVGVRESLLDADQPLPLVKTAVCLYAKALFGYDNSEASRFMQAYNQTVADLLNSSANERQGDDAYTSLSSFAEDVMDALGA